MKLIFLLAVCRLVVPLYIQTKEPNNFANNRTETKDVIHVQNQKDLVGARYRDNGVQNKENYHKQNTTDQGNNDAKDFSKTKKDWKQNRTMLEKFYDYVKKERELLEKQMESTNVKQHMAVMKIPKKKYANKKRKEIGKKSKREVTDSPKNTEHISRIKEEIAKLQDLVTILRDQQQIINLLDDMKSNTTDNVQKNSNNNEDTHQKTFSKELNDLKHYVKKFLVDKLETETQIRKTEAEHINKALESQQLTINNIKKVIRHIINGTSGDQQIETTKDIIGELHKLENHISEMLKPQQTPKEPLLQTKEPTTKETPRISSKMRQSTLEELLDDEPTKSEDSLLKILQRELDESDEKQTKTSESSVKKLLKLIDDAKKKKKQKDVVMKLLKAIEDKPDLSGRNLEIDDDVEEKLSFLKDEIDQLKPKDEDFEERKIGDVLKKLLAQGKPVVAKQPSKIQVDSLRKKLFDVMKQQTHYQQPQPQYNLFNCKHAQRINEGIHQHPNNYPYFGQVDVNPNINPNYGIPNNIQQNNFDQFRYNFEPQLFQSTSNQLFPNQPTFTGPYPAEYQTDRSQYNDGLQENLKYQIDGLQNVINELSSPGHVQRVDDKSTLYNLNQQVTDLKNVLSNFDVNKNQNGNSDYLNQVFQQDSFQTNGLPKIDQNQAYASPNSPVIANQNPNYRSSTNEGKRKESKSSTLNQPKSDVKTKHKRSTDENVEDLLNKILKEEIENQEYYDDTQNIDNSISLRRENERCFRRR